MSINAFTGVGTTFQRWSGQDWETIAEVRAITGPSTSRDIIDVTSLDTGEGSKEFIPGFRQGGEVNLAMTFTRETYELMRESFENKNEEDYAIVFDDVDTSYIEFLGLVSKLPLVVEADDALKANITIVITGQIEFGTGEVSAGISEEPESEDVEERYVVVDDYGNEVIDDDSNRVVHYI